MRISTTACYALDLLCVLDALRSTGPVSSSELAEYTGISDKFIQKIMRSLKFAGLVRSSRGIAGGHQLVKSSQEISLADIVRAVEGHAVAPPEHILEEHRECQSSVIWEGATQRMERILSEYTLDVIAQNLPQTFIPAKDFPVCGQDPQGVTHEKKCNLGRQRSRKCLAGTTNVAEGL